MKAICKLFLLVSLICLTGCSSDDPQSVAFSTNKMDIDRMGGKFTVDVKANCPWTIKEAKNYVYVSPSSGNGDQPVIVNVLRNETYNEQTHTLTLTSEDGTSISTLNIHQQEALGLIAANPDIIPGEGGTFTIPVQTNDNVQVKQLPNWITFTSSRGLTDYTYTFTAEPNKTGTTREGTLTLQGTKKEQTVTVKQDSYAPTDIVLGKDITYISERNFKTTFSIVPEYSDPSKLAVSTSEGCDVSIKEGELYIGLQDYGKFCISFFSNGKEITKTTGEYLPSKPFYLEDIQEAYLGQSDFIQYWYYTKDYTLHSSNEDVVTIGEDGKPYAVGYGRTMVSVTHPSAICYDELEIKVEPFLLEARIGWFGEQWDRTFDVRFTARIDGPKEMTVDGFLVTDKYNVVKILNNGDTKDNSPFSTIINTCAINVNTSGYTNILEALDGYQMMVQVSIDGETHQRTVKINTHHVEEY